MWLLVVHSREFLTQDVLLCEWPQHKFPLTHAYVRDIEPLMFELFIAIEKNIKVDVARALVNNFVAPHLVLYGLKLVQQLQRAQVRFDLFQYSASTPFLKKG